MNTDILVSNAVSNLPGVFQAIGIILMVGVFLRVLSIDTATVRRKKIRAKDTGTGLKNE